MFWLAAVAAFAAAPAPASLQDDVMVPPQPAPVLAPDALAQARDAAARGDQAEALSRYLRVLAATPDDVAALAGAGSAALAVGDTNAAAGFLSRADALDPRNGPVKAGLAATMAQTGNARAALRLFREAVDLGVPPASIAADRGLAYDLRGVPKRAQQEYQLALHARADDETLRRLALSQAIAGDRAAALATLDPLLRKQDVPAWRARAFVFALTGDGADALPAARLVMPSDQVAAFAPYLTRLATLKPAEKAAAIHLGRFPGEGRPSAREQTAQAAAPRLPIDRAALAPAPNAPPPTLALATPAPRAAQPVPAVAPSAAAAAPPDPVPSKAELAAQAKAETRARAAAKAKADAVAQAQQKRAEEAEARAAAKRNPPRHWVQVAGGANKADLGRAWDKLKAKWPGPLAGRTPWTLHYRFTNRLMIGPFASSKAAQDWVGERKREGFATFRVETKAGEAVEKID